MGLITSIGIYIVIWWVVLFAVLPFGVRAQAEAGEVIPGSEPGAPAAPQLLAKALWTTAISLVIFIVFYVVYTMKLIDVEKFSTLWGWFPR